MFRRRDAVLHLIILVALPSASCTTQGEPEDDGRRDPTWFDLDGTWLNLVESPQHRSLFGGRYCGSYGTGSDAFWVQCGYGYLRTRFLEPTVAMLVYDARGLGGGCDVRSDLTSETTFGGWGGSLGTLNVSTAELYLPEDGRFRLSGEFNGTVYDMQCTLLSPRVMECVDRLDLDSGDPPLDDGIFRFEKVDDRPNTITCERVVHDFITNGGVLE
jgi:hypothetical protein